MRDYIRVDELTDKIDELLENYPDIESQIESQGCHWIRNSTEGQEFYDGIASADEIDEYVRAKEILKQLKGEGSDHSWNGDWYPSVLIADSSFPGYAKEYAFDVGLVTENTNHWPINCIDWNEAAKQLQQDYCSIEIDGTTYWYQS